MAKRHYSGPDQFAAWIKDCAILFGGVDKMQIIKTKHGADHIFYSGQKVVGALWRKENGKVDYGWIELP